MKDRWRAFRTTVQYVVELATVVVLHVVAVILHGAVVVVIFIFVLMSVIRVTIAKANSACP